MEYHNEHQSRLAVLATQLSEAERHCKTLKEKLEAARAYALQKKFDLNALEYPNFFQKHFGGHKKKKEAAWQDYRAALSAQDQIQMDYDEQSARYSDLLREYEALQTSREP